MQEARLSVKYWAQSVNTAVYLKDLSLTKAVKDTVLEEAWHG